MTKHRGGSAVATRTPPPPPPTPPSLPAGEPLSKNGMQKRKTKKRISSLLAGANVSTDTKTMESLFELEQQAEEMDDKSSICGRDNRFLGITVDLTCCKIVLYKLCFFVLQLETIFCFMKVVTAFPFVIVVSALGLSKQHTFLRWYMS